MTSPTSAPTLFTPLRIGPVESRNRIVVGAHFTQFTEPTTPGEPGFYGTRYARYLGEFARGGAGVVIGGQAAVHPTTAYQMPNNACAWDPAAVPGLAEVADAVHAHGALELPAARAQRRGERRRVVEAPGLGAVARRQLPGAAEADRAPRDRGGHRRVRPLRGQLRRRRARRRRDPRRARLPDPRVPLAPQQPPHRRVRRRPRRADAVLRRGAARRCAPRWVRRWPSACGWSATRRPATAPGSVRTTRPRSRPGWKRRDWSTS